MKVEHLFICPFFILKSTLIHSNILQTFSFSYVIIFPLFSSYIYSCIIFCNTYYLHKKCDSQFARTRTLGSYINYVDKFLDSFYPAPPLFVGPFIFNKAYVVIWIFGKLPLPLPCPHGLWMSPLQSLPLLLNSTTYLTFHSRNITTCVDDTKCRLGG